MSFLVLGLETSCDETAAGVVEVESRRVLSNVIASQHQVHARYGGVVPELASRQHLSSLLPVVRAALDEAGVGPKDLHGLAVTYGPGLAGCLTVGLSAAKALALGWDLPWVGVNHLEGHLLAAFLEHADLDYPFLGLVVSGGHTSLHAVRSAWNNERLATTRDDAAGEAFDKVAKMLELGFPGGPALDRLARSAQARTDPGAVLPEARMKDGSLDFSYSGLKTAVLYRLRDLKARGEIPDAAALAAAFQEAAIRPIIKRVLEAAARTGYTRVVAGGGVAANSLLREELPRAAAAAGLKAYLCSLPLCVDNGAMIAYAGGLRLLRGEQSGLDLGVAPDLTLG